MAKKQEAKENTALTFQGNQPLPAELAELAQQYAPNAGMENIEQSDLKRPFYRIIQPTSKEVAVGNDKYIEDAKIGMWIESTITRQISHDVKVVPLHIIKGYSEFTPQNQGGGFLGFHLAGTDRVRNAIDSEKFGTKMTAEGTELKETWQMFCLIDPVAKGQPVVGIIGFSGNSLAAFKKFVTYTNSLGHALFLKQYRFTTEPKFNKQYNSTTFIPKFNQDESEFLPVEIAQVAGECYKQLDAAAMQAMVSATAEDAADGDDGLDAAVAASME